MGVPVDTTTRDMDMNTEDMLMVDQEVQYVYGDDTSLINAMKRVEARRHGRHVEDEDIAETAANGSRQPGTTAAVQTDEVVNENRLNTFLQAAAQLCEDLLHEEQAAAKQERSGRHYG